MCSLVVPPRVQRTIPHHEDSRRGHSHADNDSAHELKRLDLIAQNIVDHWEKRKSALLGKCMIVTMSRRIAVDLYDKIVALRHDPSLSRPKSVQCLYIWLFRFEDESLDTDNCPSMWVSRPTCVAWPASAASQVEAIVRRDVTRIQTESRMPAPRQ